MTNLQSQRLGNQDTVYALTRSGGTIFAARASGLYRSDDDGEQWHLAYKTIDVEVAHPLVTTAVAARGQAVFAGVKGAILRSSNGGADWFTAVLPPPAPLVSVLALSPNFDEDGVAIAGTAEDGVFVSVDRGLRWMPWNFGLLDLGVYSIVFSPEFAVDQTIYIGTESGIFHSKNGGRAWRAVPFPMDAAPVLGVAFAPDSAGNHRLFAGTEANGLYVSDDNGGTWERVLPDRIQGAVNAIVSVPSKPLELWILLEDRLQISRDNGHTWAGRASAFAASAQALAVLPPSKKAQDILVGFSDGTILHIP